MYDPSWMITEPVMVKADPIAELDPAGVARLLVRSFPDAATSYRECALRYDGTELTFNNGYVDVGDDLMIYLGLMDEALSFECPDTWRRIDPDPDNL